MNGNRRAIPATCSMHRGPASFANLLVSKRDGEIGLGPYADGSCVITLDEDEATAVRDVFTEWLG